MLEELDLSNNQFGPIACKTIGLALSHQKIMIVNTTHFFSPLENLSELKVLDLSWNEIRDGDIRPICQSLKVIDRITLEKCCIIMSDESIDRTSQFNDEWIG